MRPDPPIPDRSLWAAVHCSDLPLKAAHAGRSADQPMAVHGRSGGQTRIEQANGVARRAGIRPGQPLASALSLQPALHCLPRDRALERLLLEEVAMTAYTCSQQVALLPPTTVVLEIAGSTRLHGGSDRLLDQLREKLSRHDFRVRLGSAPHPAAAALLSRFERHAFSRKSLSKLLDRLPLSCLPLATAHKQPLSGCGLRTLGELTALPAGDRVRRFGPEIEATLQRLYGRQDMPLQSWRPPDAYELRLELPQATAQTQPLLFIFRRASEHLAAWLQSRDRALQRLQIVLEKEDESRATRFEIGLARPGQDRGRLLELIALKLDTLDLDAPVQAVRLKADCTLSFHPAQADLFAGHHESEAWTSLVDRLRARLGEQGLVGLSARADHRPERAWTWVEPGTSEAAPRSGPRPNWLLPEPQPCCCRELTFEDGPERIETGWWDGGDCRRDYWIATDRHGWRLWVFREYKPRSGWFVHGLFD
jgi:protein ImuB